MLIIAIVGTTVAPWQLFFQQSNIVDKRITPRWINYERADTVLGSFVTVIGAVLIVVTCAFAFMGTRYFGNFTNAGGVASALGHVLGHAAGALICPRLVERLDHRGGGCNPRYFLCCRRLLRDASFAPPELLPGEGVLRQLRPLVAFAAAIVLIPGAPLGVITVAVQALAGVLLPSASVFLLLLCNDREVLGPWVNRPWLNAVATFIIGVLLVMSLILVATTVFPKINVGVLSLVLGGALVLGLVVSGIFTGCA